MIQKNRLAPLTAEDIRRVAKEWEELGLEEDSIFIQKRERGVLWQRMGRGTAIMPVGRGKQNDSQS
jgi:hypothetical protein